MTETSNPKWEQELREALVNAVAPPPLAEARHERILREALADPLAPPTVAELAEAEALRRALASDGDSTDALLARALRHAVSPPSSADGSAAERALEQALPKRRGNVVFVTFGVAASALALAAAVALVLRPVARAPEVVSQRELVPSRSFAALLDAESARLPASARLDLLVAARERDLRSNRYSAWGVR